MWHVRAEAQRQVRTIDLTAERASAWWTCWSMRCSIAAPLPSSHRLDNIEEPEALRRVDGSSVYTVAGADLYTSQRILDAEARLVAAADIAAVRHIEQRRWIWPCSRWRRTAPHSMLGRLAWSARCTSGARLQLAIAPPAPGRPPPCAPSPGLDPRRRSGARPGPVGGRGRCPRRANRDPHRHPRQTHLVTAARRPAGLGGSDRPIDIGDHRRSRHGRHPVPRHRRPVRHRPRCERPADR